MSVSTPDVPPVDGGLQELSEESKRAFAFYEERLKPTLEPQNNGKAIAIHPDSGDYALGDTTGDALRALLPKHPEGGMVLFRIGPPTPGEFRHASRLLGDQAPN
jgi:hypothetical protein